MISKMPPMPMPPPYPYLLYPNPPPKIKSRIKSKSIIVFSPFYVTSSPFRKKPCQLGKRMLPAPALQVVNPTAAAFLSTVMLGGVPERIQQRCILSSGSAQLLQRESISQSLVCPSPLG